MLAAIGETFETPLAVADPSLPSGPPPTADLITGVIFSTRPNFYRIAIWTRASPGPEAEAATDELLKRITLVGRNFKTAVMGYEEGKPLVVGSGGFQTEVEFINHRDSEKKDKKVRRSVAQPAPSYSGSKRLTLTPYLTATLAQSIRKIVV
jgi:translation initiation factor 4E